MNGKFRGGGYKNRDQNLGGVLKLRPNFRGGNEKHLKFSALQANFTGHRSRVNSSTPHQVINYERSLILKNALKTNCVRHLLSVLLNSRQFMFEDTTPRYRMHPPSIVVQNE